MSLVQNAADMIAYTGESMTLSRTGETDISLKGKRMLSGAAIIGGTGTSAQREFSVKIAPTELAASSWTTKVPRRTDTLTVAGRVHNVMDVRPISDGDTVAMYELLVAG